MKKKNDLLRRISALSLSSALFLGSINASAVFTIQDLNDVSIEIEDSETSISYMEENMAIDDPDPGSAWEDPVPVQEVDNIEDFQQEVMQLNQDIGLESDSIYAARRLIIISDDPDFETYGPENILSYGNIYILSYASENDTRAAYNALRNDNGIISVEVDSIVETNSVMETAPLEVSDAIGSTGTESPEESSSISNNGLDITKDISDADTEPSEKSDPVDNDHPLGETDNISDSPASPVFMDGIRIAVIDSGIDKNNPIFENRVIDLGLNFSTSGDGIQDDNGHGTAVASIIAKYSDASIMPVKIANSDGKGTVLSLYLAIRAAIENDADIINLSMTTSTSELLTSAIEEASDAGIKVVAAAGNQNADVKDYAPANIDRVITVSAVDQDLSPASYSNHGSMIDYAAIGTDVRVETLNGTGTMSGTSLSAAYVSAVMAYAMDSGTDFNAFVYPAGSQEEHYGKGIVSFEPVDITDLPEKIPVGEDPSESESGDTDWIFVSEDGTVYDRNSISLEAAITSDGITYTYASNKLTLTGSGTVTNIWQTYNTTWSGYVAKVKTIQFNSTGITGVDSNAFDDCTALATVTITKCGWDNATGSISCFKNKDTIKTVTVAKGGRLCQGMFEGCTGITALTVTSTGSDGGIDTIPASCFQGCTSLTTVTVPKGIDTIGASAFNGCSALTTVTFTATSSLTSIKDHAFAGCSSLTDIKGNGNDNTLPNTVQSIGDYAFTDCTSLETLNYGTVTIKEVGNDGSIPQTITSSLHSIGTSAFSGCSRLSQFKLTGSSLCGCDAHLLKDVSSIGNNAFSGTAIKDICVLNKDAGGLISGGQTVRCYMDSVASKKAFESKARVKYILWDQEYNNGEISYAYDCVAGDTGTGPSHPSFDKATNRYNGIFRYEIDIDVAGDLVISGLLQKYWSSINTTKKCSAYSTLLVWVDAEEDGPRNEENATVVIQETAKSRHLDTETVCTLTPGHHVIEFYAGVTHRNHRINSKNVDDMINVFVSYIGVYQNGYAVSYNGNGATGGETKMQSKVEGSSITIQQNGFSRTGYIFTGWNTKADGSGTAYTAGATYTADASLTLYAQWRLNNFNITYNGNGNTGGSTVSQTKNAGVSISLQQNGFTRTGYAFTGWNTKADGTGTAYAAGAAYSTDASLTLYAQWTRNTFTISYNGNGNTGGSTASQTKNAGTAVNLQQNGFTRTGYHFTGWNTAANGTGTAYTAGAAYNSDSDLNLYAQWAVNTSTLKVNPSGGTWNGNTNVQSFTQNYNTTKNIPIPAKTGYTFTGWTMTGTNGTMSSLTADATYTFGAVNGATDTLTAVWKVNEYTVTYIDAVDSTSGKELGRSTAPKPYDSTVRGADKGNSTADNAYYHGYYYAGDTSAKVTTSGATVYRIFRQRMTTITGNIIWEDWNNKNGSRPDDVTLYIHGSDGNTYTYTITGDNSQSTSTNKWPYSEELPKYDSNGKEIIYTVSQDKAISQEEGLAYKDPVVNGYDITNKITNDTPKDYIKIPVTITWDDENDQHGFRPDTITVQLLQNGTVIETISTSGDYTFTGMLKYDENGDKYVYTIQASDEDRYTKAENNSAPYNKTIIYTFTRPSYSVTIPKIVILDGKTGLGEYVVSVRGQIDDRDYVNVIPDDSFTMKNDSLSPITATIEQDRTAFTNKDNIKDGAISNGTIAARSLAGKWSGNFNFNIYFEFGR